MELQSTLVPATRVCPDDRRVRHDASLGRALSALLLALAMAAALPAAAQVQRASGANSTAAAHPTRAFWQDVRGTPASARGAQPAVRPDRFRAVTLDMTSLAALAATAPLERSQAARQNPLVLALPDPNGGFQRFSIVDSPVMEPGLAARHPGIGTYAGRGVDDLTATLRMSITPLGLQASVRSQQGAWYIDSYYHLDDSLYVSYFGRDLPNRRPQAFTEPLIFLPQMSLDRGRYHATNTVSLRGAGFQPGAQVTFTVKNAETDAAARQTLFAIANDNGSVSVSFKADPYRNLGSYEVSASDGRASTTTTYQVVPDHATLNAAIGNQLRTYRLALVTDPAYATYFGGGANVTAAKVALINRVNQVYEDDSSIRMVLVANNDLLNLDTAALATQANGPCGGAACYTAGQLNSCGSGSLTRTRIVTGLLIGASNFDVGHLALGGDGGGVAGLGVVGLDQKALGCTGINPPIGDLFAIDFVAHELGHQFAANHTFNGTVGGCSGGNRNAATSVEPGSGSSVMAYAGICGTDNLQSNTDPYWSQRSLDEIVAHTSASESNLNEVQQGVLTGFSANGKQFQLRFNGADSTPIVRGTNYTTAGVKAAIETIPGWPAGGTVAISTLGDNAFTITFGGTLAGVNLGTLELLNCSSDCSGYVGEIRAGGPSTRRGAVSDTGNSIPTVAVAGSEYTIPVRTPFALTGSGADADNDSVTFMWEQTDRGGASGTALTNNVKANGPLFRVFSTRSVFDSSQYAPPGQNTATTDPTRVFPDMAQILANNTNAETGTCTSAVAVEANECFSEFLPTAAYVGFGANAGPAALNFKLTARDGRGGVNSASTRLVLAPAAGPFLVTSPNSALTWDGTTQHTVTWNPAGTGAAPVGTASVRISLSSDGGQTYPITLAASTPNNGSRVVTLPNLATRTARIKVEAIDNIFFDVSNADFTIRLTGDVDGDGAVGCGDLAIVRASMGKRSGDAGFDGRADVNNDGIVDVRDLAYVAQRVSSNTRCT